NTSRAPEYRQSLMFGFVGLILAYERSDFSAIQQELNSRIAKVEFPTSECNHFETKAESYFESAASEILGSGSKLENRSGMFLAIMFGAAFLFMLLPTINLVNINISRIIERASEIGVRKSFGASAHTLVGQFLVENILLAFIGGIIGFALSTVVLHTLTNSGLIQYAEFHLNIRIFLYAFACILFFGVLSGVYPAWKMSRMHPVNALKGVMR
ncbi:MAG: FtsX-like permease family protein, partial [Ignavibacteriales bacterium]|nr:FtsX-like permease family protein [Ignavibacteriales bacterium]